MSKVALITGANGSVGEGIAIKLLEQSVDIKLILACRSMANGDRLKKSLLNQFPTLIDLNVFILQLDLSDSQKVFNSCQIVLSKFKRLDYLFLNAGILSRDGVDIMLGFKNLLTRPSYVAKTGGDIIIQPVGEITAEGFGKSFMCNFFGHFIMVMHLQPLLSATNDSRIIWCSSTTACPEFFDFDDIQCIKGTHPYESSKRLCELMSIQLQNYLKKSRTCSLITSPGVVYSGISKGELHGFLIMIAFLLMRLFGCSGINISGTNSATSAVWIANQENPENLNPQTMYHSDITIFGKTFVREIPLMVSESDRELSIKTFTDVLNMYHSVHQRWNNNLQ
ncbi:hypothetical protein BC833DRAFT_602162 [Globomyces pollinis-pini]|nr:hypothetical protein BC833DRAFT_602162 [Globomyces pollinis-pini]